MLYAKKGSPAPAELPFRYVILFLENRENKIEQLSEKQFESVKKREVDYVSVIRFKNEKWSVEMKESRVFGKGVNGCLTVIEHKRIYKIIY